MPAESDLRTLHTRAQHLLIRHWLQAAVEDALQRAPVVAIIGPPGSGKSVVVHQLAAAWNCCAYYARPGSAGSALSSDPKAMLVSLGLQLRARYGAEIFGDALLEIDVKAKAAGPGGDVTAAAIGTVSVSPFRRIAIHASVQVDELEGAAAALRISEVRDVVAEMTVGELAVEALLNPLRRLRALRRGEVVRLIVDAIEAPEMAAALPLPSELPDNARLLLTTRLPEAVDRLAADDAGAVERLMLSGGRSRCAPSTTSRCTCTASSPSPPWRTRSALRPTASARSRRSRTNLLRRARATLYAYHLAGAIRAGVARGEFGLLAPGAAPRGLDGVYRHFVSNLVRAGVTARDWAEQRAPVLGILAVARGPLTTRQLAALSGIAPLALDVTLATIELLLVPVDADGDRAVSFYHASFAEFLLDQDRRRNATPLEPSATHHRLILSRYAGLDADAWDASNDVYALRHLPEHACACAEHATLVQLMRGPFGLRQTIFAGPAQTYADCVAGARSAAAAANLPAALLLIETAGRAAGDIEAQWHDGRFVLALLSAQSERPVLEHARRASAHFQPWSALLAAERLLDLDKPDAAGALLRDLAAQPWSDYKPPQHGFDLLERTSFDFIPEHSLADFLAHVASFDSDLAFALVERLFDADPVLPNIRTAWRDVLDACLDRADPARIDWPALAETTLTALRKPGYMLGAVGITRALWRVLEHCVQHGQHDPLWFANAILLAQQRRSEAGTTIVGAEEGAEVLGFLADLTLSLAKLRRASDAAGTDAALTPVLADTLQLALSLVPAPKFEAHVGECARAEWRAQLAYAMHLGADPRSSEHAHAALECARHDIRWKRYAKSHAKGLSWLLHAGQPKVAEQAHTLLASIGEDEVPLAELERLDATAPYDIPAARADALQALTTSGSPYERGRIALALGRREGAACRNEVEAALAAARRTAPRGRRKPPPALFRDVMTEALAAAVAASGMPRTDALLATLTALRSERARDEAVLAPDAVRDLRWWALGQRGDHSTVAREAEEQLARAHASGDAALMLHACLALVRADVDRAAPWVEKLEQALDDLRERSLAIALAVMALRNHHPERCTDLGAAWAARVAAPSGQEVGDLECTVCRSWPQGAPFDDLAIRFLEHLAATAGIAHEQALRHAATLGAKDRSDAERESWRQLGRFLECAARVAAVSERVDAARARLADAVLVISAQADPSAWQARHAASLVLEGLARSAHGKALPQGPVADAVCALFARAVEWPAPAGDADPPPVQTVPLGMLHRLAPALAATALLKATHPQWSTEQFTRGRSLLAGIVAGRVREDNPMPGLADAMIAAFGGAGRRTREATNLARSLAVFCTVKPHSRHELLNLQGDIVALADRDLRFHLTGSLARSWLALRDFDRAARTAQIASLDALAADRVPQFLAHELDPQSLEPTQHDALRALLLDLVARAAGERADVLDLLLGAWLRAALEGSVAERDRQLEALVHWLEAAARDDTWSVGAGA